MSKSGPQDLQQVVMVPPGAQALNFNADVARSVLWSRLRAIWPGLVTKNFYTVNNLGVKPKSANMR